MSSQSRQFATTIANGQHIPLLVNAPARGNDIYVRISPRTTQVITEVIVSGLHPVNHVSEGQIYLDLCQMALHPIAIADFSENQATAIIIAHCRLSTSFASARS
jgi:hypothetical protein